jgi:hypothetical protein
MDSTFLRVIEGKNGGKNDERPRIPFELGQNFLIVIYDDRGHEGRSCCARRRGVHPQDQKDEPLLTDITHGNAANSVHRILS